MRLVLANNDLAAGRLERARSNYLAVVEADPDNAVARNNLAWLLWQSGDAEAALPHAERALELAANNPGILDTAGVVLLELENTDRAVSLFRNAADRLPANSEIRYHLAQALAKQGNADEARGILREILSEASEFPQREEAQALLEGLEN